MPAPAIAIIINPISGTGGRPDRARRLLGDVTALMAERRLEHRVWLTERAGHACELAAEAVRQGIGTVVAWGGDGTVNEVATTLAFTPARLAIVPAGSGNGLARGLGIPLNAMAALDVASNGQQAVMDVGEIDGRRFVNVAGIGLDAAIAHAFAATGLKRRGFRRYVEITLREAFAYRAPDLTVTSGDTVHVRPLLLALANGPQFGSGAVIAPDARVDDGKLDMVVAAERSPLIALLQAPRLFRGGATRLPGVTHRLVSDVTITAVHPILYHVDGEPCVGGKTVHVSVHPGALKVMVPAAGGRVFQNSR